MKVIKETINNEDFFIQVTSNQVDIINDNTGPSIVDTSIEEQAKKIYSKTKSLIKEIAMDIGEELRSIPDSNKPKQVEMEFNVAISADINAPILFSSSGECGFTITITWTL